jgi:hypothetical protein
MGPRLNRSWSRGRVIYRLHWPGRRATITMSATEFAALRDRTEALWATHQEYVSEQQRDQLSPLTFGLVREEDEYLSGIPSYARPGAAPEDPRMSWRPDARVTTAGIEGEWRLTVTADGSVVSLGAAAWHDRDGVADLCRLARDPAAARRLSALTDPNAAAGLSQDAVGATSQAALIEAARACWQPLYRAAHLSGERLRRVLRSAHVGDMNPEHDAPGYDPTVGLSFRALPLAADVALADPGLAIRFGASPEVGSVAALMLRQGSTHGAAHPVAGWLLEILHGGEAAGPRLARQEAAWASRVDSVLRSRGTGLVVNRDSTWWAIRDEQVFDGVYRAALALARRQRPGEPLDGRAAAGHRQIAVPRLRHTVPAPREASADSTGREVASLVAPGEWSG